MTTARNPVFKPLVLRLRANRARIIVVMIVGSIAVLATLRMDLIRLGPKTVTLPDNALELSGSWARHRDGNPVRDYYTIWVHVESHSGSDSIVPYAIVVNISTPGSIDIVEWLPMAGDNGEARSMHWSDLAAPVELDLSLPAGRVTHDSGNTYSVWHVQGERGLASQAIFREGADFLLGTLFPENATMEAHVDVILTWYYENPFQAYPVASGHRTATCLYIPDTDSEHSAPYSTCGYRF